MTGQRTFAAHRLILSTTGAAFVPFHAGNDGVGSGLDADMLDGLTSGQFARSDVAQTIAPLWNFTTPPTINGAAIWNAANDGPGSGLDADTVDGSHGSSFAAAGHVHAAHSHSEYLPFTGGVISGELHVAGNFGMAGHIRVNPNPVAGTIVFNGANLSGQLNTCLIIRNRDTGAIMGYVPLFSLAP
jgi:hypothetical protein